MSQRTIVVFRPRTEGDEDRVLAEGIRVCWGAALVAGGGDVLLPCQEVGREYDPLGVLPGPESVAGKPGRFASHDGQPASGDVEAVVRSRLVRGPGSARVIVSVVQAERPPLLRSGQTFRGATAELRAMASTLHTIGDALGLRVPDGIGWRELTFSKKTRDGLAHLWAAGLEALPPSGRPPELMLH